MTTACARSGATSSSTRPCWSARCRRSSGRCPPRCSRPSSSTTRSRSRSATTRGRIGRFAAITNGDGAAAAEIVRGMERVVVARLRDAAFFLAEDRKRPLADRVPDLAGVTFHQGLGTYRDKSARMEALVEAMGGLGLLDGGRARGGPARGAARQGGPRHPDGPRVPGAAGRHGRDLPRRRGRAGRGGRRRCAGTTTRSRSRRRPSPRVPSPAPTTGRASSRPSPSPTSSTRWPATSASARARPAAATPTACGAPGRARCAPRSTSGGRSRARRLPTSKRSSAPRSRATAP